MNLHAQGPTWTKTCGTPLNDAGYSIAKTYDGGYIAGGTNTYDMGNKDINLQRNGLNGLLFFKVYEEGVCIISTKAFILNK